MNTEFFNALELLEKEKGIPQDYMLEKVEAALLSALKKEIGPTVNIRVATDKTKKEMRVFRQRTVVEEVTDEISQISLEDAKRISNRYKMDSVVETEMKPKSFRRLSAQAAKQVIIQGIREAERTMVSREYGNKKEEMLTATVYQVDNVDGSLILDTGIAHLVLKREEQLPDDSFAPGDYVRVLIVEVKNPGDVRDSRPGNGGIVTVSRRHPGLVKRLFEKEVPEIQDGTVIIKSVSRDPGSRSKVAVFSRDENVDPVGACVGNHSIRISNVCAELGAEKIDVVRYYEDPAKYIESALAPAVIKSVEIDAERCARVTVDPDQLSLAIGRAGQNAKLAAKLTGYKIDIKA